MSERKIIIDLGKGAGREFLAFFRWANRPRRKPKE